MADIRLSKVPSGTNQTVACTPDSRFVFDFPTEETTMSRNGDNLVFTFDDGGSIELTDFYTTYNSEKMPDFEVDGATISGADFFTAMNEPDLMPAAGPAGVNAADRARFHEYDNMDLLGGLDRLGGLDLGFGQAEEPEEHREGDGSISGDEDSEAQSPVSPENPAVPVEHIQITSPAQIVVDEGAMPHGTGEHAEHGVSGHGSFSVDLLGANGTITLGEGADAVTLTVSDNGQSVSGGGSVTVNGVRISVTGAELVDGKWQVKYDYELTDNVTHAQPGKDGADDAVSSRLPILITNQSGETAESVLNVTVHDDAPSLTGIVIQGASDDGTMLAPAKGELRGKLEGFSFGADDGAGKSIELTFGTTELHTIDGNTVEHIISETVKGTLDASGDYVFSVGSYMITLDPESGEFTCSNAFPNSSASPAKKPYDFTFKVTDSDGDFVEQSAHVQMVENPDAMITNNGFTVQEAGKVGTLIENVPGVTPNSNLFGTENLGRGEIRLEDASLEITGASLSFSENNDFSGKSSLDDIEFADGNAVLYVVRNPDGSFELSASAPGAYLGTLTFTINTNNNASWVFAPNAEEFNKLCQGESINIQVGLKSGTAEDTLNLTLKGADDGPDVFGSHETVSGFDTINQQNDGDVFAGGVGWWQGEDNQWYQTKSPGEGVDRIEGWAENKGASGNGENTGNSGCPVTSGRIDFADPDHDGVRFTTDENGERTGFENGSLCLWLSPHSDYHWDSEVRWEDRESFDELKDTEAFKKYGNEMLTGEEVNELLRGSMAESTQAAANLEFFQADETYVRIDGEYGSLFVNWLGEYHYVLSVTPEQAEKVAALTVGSTLQNQGYEEFQLGVTDQYGVYSAPVIGFAVYGANDAPKIININDEMEVTYSPEGVESATAGGKVEAVDVDVDAAGNSDQDSLRYAFVDADGKLVQTITTKYGMYAIDAESGEYTFTLADKLPEVMELQQYIEGRQPDANGSYSDRLFDHVHVAVVDRLGAADVQEVTVTIKGQNSDPKIESITHDREGDYLRVDAADAAGNGGGWAKESLSGQVNGYDINKGDALTYSFSIGGNGELSEIPGSIDLEKYSISKDKACCITTKNGFFLYDSQSGKYAYILGENPTAAPGGSEETITVTVTDGHGGEGASADFSVLIYGKPEGDPGDVIFINPPCLNVTASGEGYDGFGAEITQNISASSGFEKGDVFFIKSLKIDGEEISIEGMSEKGNSLVVQTDYGVFTINKATGDYSFSTEDADRHELDSVVELAAGEQMKLEFTLGCTKQSGQKVDVQPPVSILINGANDAPTLELGNLIDEHGKIILEDTFNVDKTTVSDSTSEVRGSLAAALVDADGDSAYFQLVDGSGNPVSSIRTDYGEFVLNANGDYVLHSNGHASGEQEFNVTVRVTDAQGKYTDQTLTIGIEGDNDRPFIEHVGEMPVVSYKDNGEAVTATGMFKFTDVDSEWQEVKLAGEAGIQNPDGTLTYTLHGTYGDLTITVKHDWLMKPGDVYNHPYNPRAEYSYTTNPDSLKNLDGALEESFKFTIDMNGEKSDEFTMTFPLLNGINHAPEVIVTPDADVPGSGVFELKDRDEDDPVRLDRVEAEGQLVSADGTLLAYALVQKNEDEDVYTVTIRDNEHGNKDIVLGFLNIQETGDQHYSYEFRIADGVELGDYGSLSITVSGADSHNSKGNAVIEINLPACQAAQGNAGGQAEEMPDEEGMLLFAAMSGEGAEAENTLAAEEDLAGKLRGEDARTDILFGRGSDDYLRHDDGQDMFFDGSDDLIFYDKSDYLVHGGDGIDFLLSGKNDDLHLNEILANADPNAGPLVSGVEVLLKGDAVATLTSVRDLEDYGITVRDDALILDNQKWTLNQGGSYENGSLILETTLTGKEQTDGSIAFIHDPASDQADQELMQAITTMQADTGGC